MAMTNLNVQVDNDIIGYAKKIFAERGTTVEEAVGNYLMKIVDDYYDNKLCGRPLTEEDKADLREAEDILSGKLETKAYTDVDEMFADILAEEDDDDQI